MFYPLRAEKLETDVAAYLSTVPAFDGAAKAIIAPHAGYRYSGPIAAHAYRAVEARRGRVTRVVLLGPAHRVFLEGMALPSADSFATPLGEVPVDAAGIQAALGRPGTWVSNAAHADEHSLEVQLPFLQTVLDDFEIVPVVVGVCPVAEVAALLDELWGGEETLIVVSSDLSHYHSYERAQAIDAATTAKIEARDATLRGDEACGAYSVNGLLAAATSRGLAVRTLDVRNSGDTAGDRQRVVGYGAYALA